MKKNYKRTCATLFCAVCLGLGVVPLLVQGLRGQTPAGGRAAAEEANAALVEKSLVDVIVSGGVVMVPILGCSVLMLVFLFERAISLRRSRVIPAPFVKRILLQLRESQVDRDEALELCRQNNSPIARVFGGALKKWGRLSVEIEQAVIDCGERENQGLRKYLRVFSAISTIAPLLGLLGTVTGMIRCFSVIARAKAMGRPELLASGVSEALVTTAAGLCLAIVSFCIYFYFVSRVDRLVMEIDRLAQQLVDIIAGDGLPENKEPRQSKTAAGKRRTAAA
jgi:biopolymer transport protein ExbB